ncbi:MAG: alcohol dehydrogenase catalytic domain-containing protein, partial [Chloroflexi bacterium]|nr:alcohol dehydrogenase catalytic domain-containing protein [Chloroflexota bacterium]
MVKAAVLYETKKPLQIKELRQDPPRAGEVRVQMGASGICLSDHHLMQGTSKIDLPAVIGHEGAGTVVEVGDGVTRVKPGDRCIIAF